MSAGCRLVVGINQFQLKLLTITKAFRRTEAGPLNVGPNFTLWFAMNSLWIRRVEHRK